VARSPSHRARRGRSDLTITSTFARGAAKEMGLAPKEDLAAEGDEGVSIGLLDLLLGDLGEHCPNLFRREDLWLKRFHSLLPD